MSAAFAEEIAVIPYKIDVPSKEFPVSLGAEYAKLIATGALIAGLEVHSPRELETDLARSNINPQGTLSADDLTALGKSRLIDFFVAGTLYKSQSGYISESVLFSVKKGSVTARAKVSAADLAELGERELISLFPGKARFPSALQVQKIDIALLIDCSYSIASEWKNIKTALEKVAEEMTGAWNGQPRISLMPFSTAYAMGHASIGLKSAYSFARALDAITPKGVNDEKTIERALADSLKNLTWRSDSSKRLILILNTPLTSTNRLRNLAQSARRKGIVVYTIALGGMYGEGREYFRELSIIGGGKHFDVAYHKKLYDARGEEISLYLEAGRLFTSNGFDRRWKDGLFIGRPGGPASERPKAFLKEIFFDEKKLMPTPAKMGRLYEQYAKMPIIREEEAVSNIASIASSLAEKVYKGGSGAQKPLGRVLVYQDTHSLWLDIVRPEDLDFFRKKVKSKEVFFLGVSIEEKRDEPFGIRFNPERYVTAVPSEYLPELLKVRLEKLVKEKAHYSTHGLFQPPVWFVELKAERVKFHKGSDVRDE